jgi:alginate lyase
MNRTASRLLPLGSHRSRLAGASAAAVLSMSLMIGLGPVLEDAGLPGAPDIAAAAGPHLIASAAEIARLPRTGAAWRSLKRAADSNAGRPDLSNQDSDNDVLVLAKALVYAKTKILRYRLAVYANLRAAIGTENGGRTLAAGRNIPAYVIAADLISLPTWRPAFNNRIFRPWLRRLLTKNLDGDTLIGTQERRPNNWGTHAGAARAAIAIYLGDRRQLARTARVFHGWLGTRTAYAGFRFGDTSWQCNPARPVGINPMGCVKNGHVIDGALPDDMRRGGTFQWPPGDTNYPWEAMQGAVLEAELLQRAGYPAWSWNNRALLRAAQFLYNRVGWAATSDDDWQPWLLDYRYGTRFRRAGATHTGKNFGWTDWLYSRRVRGTPRR